MNWYKKIKISSYNFFDYGAWLTPEAKIIPVNSEHLPTIQSHLNNNNIDYEDAFALNYIRLIYYDPDFLSAEGANINNLSELQKSILKSMFMQKKREYSNARFLLEFNDYNDILDNIIDFDEAVNFNHSEKQQNELVQNGI